MIKLKNKTESETIDYLKEEWENSEKIVPLEDFRIYMLDMLYHNAKFLSHSIYSLEQRTEN